MKLIVCVDEQWGMSFGGRRQSRDRAVSARILELLAGETLWLHPDSAKLFPEGTAQLCQTAPSGQGYYFWEFGEPGAWLEHVKQIVVFHWNRLYPADSFFPKEQFSEHWKPVTCREFSGTSHEKITEEVFDIEQA